MFQSIPVMVGCAGYVTLLGLGWVAGLIKEWQYQMSNMKPIQYLWVEIKLVSTAAYNFVGLRETDQLVKPF